MIEIILKTYLGSVLRVPVVMEAMQGACVVIEKTSGRERDRLKTAVVALQSYGKTLLEAAKLNERVKKAMRRAPEINAISSAKLNSDYNFTDPKTKRYRYQAVYDIVYFDEEN